MSKWIKWNGGECPVHPDTIVRVQFRDETRYEADMPGCDKKASDWDWSHRKGSWMNILAYRIIEGHQPTIAETIREAAINWPVFLGDVECGILDSFSPIEYVIACWKVKAIIGTNEEELQARTFMLLVSEALE